MDNFATEMISMLKSNSKRLFILLIITLILWFSTIGLFVWYINQPIEEIYTQEADTEGENSYISQKIGD